MDVCPECGSAEVREYPGALGPAEGWYGEPETAVEAAYTLHLGECSACGAKVSRRVREGGDASPWQLVDTA